MKSLSAVILLVFAAASLFAQEAAPRNPNPPRHFYRLAYVLKEFDEGKVINQRDFTVDASTGDRYSSRVRAGSRYPVTEADKINYIDVGVNIDNRLEEVPDGLAMEVTAEISSTATPSATTGGAPVIRQMRTNANAVVASNKPTMLFAIDDPASRHRFELEVTAVPQK